MQLGFGGDTLNTAVYLARLGGSRVNVRYATALGEDALSSRMMARWAAEGIGLDLVRRLPDGLPGLYMIALDEHGERSFSYWRDKAAAKRYFETGLTPLEAWATEWDALYVSGISLAFLPDAGRERLFALMRELRLRGRTSSSTTTTGPASGVTSTWPGTATSVRSNSPARRWSPRTIISFCMASRRSPRPSSLHRGSVRERY